MPSFRIGTNHNQGKATLKPIETHYKGYRFRSRLEARWAVFFDALGIKWEYEKEGFCLDGVGYYLPDFWLSHLGVWAEVKPEDNTLENTINVQQELLSSQERHKSQF